MKLKNTELKNTGKKKRLVLQKTDIISLADKVYAELEEMIVTLQFKPGQMLSESELGEMLQVSRTPIGEALQRLAREGLVNILPRRGIVVTEINIADQLKLLEFRCVVSRFAAGSAARRSSDEERKQMQAIADQLLGAVKTRDGHALLQADKAFHDHFSTCVRNEFASRALDSLDSLSRRFWFVYHQSQDDAESGKLHANLALAISNGDSKAAERASDELFESLEKFVHQTLKR
ncbi:GntR family transcriptional regulator [beta proteobacterium CB]|nr:GntR family transcriptional regulator [beta proteobacterium CB]MBT8584246.1 GntR family transcriptional regulator [Polynucleobacter paneuropaeus]